MWVAIHNGIDAGEVVKIDPKTNRVAARIDGLGRAGDLTAGAGAIWVLSDREFTDESPGGASLHQIDPRTNQITATPLRDELSSIGGAEMSPVMAAGRGSVWLKSAKGHIPLAVRLNVRTGAVVRKRIRHFSPVAVTDEGIWFMAADLRRLDARTYEVDRSVRAPSGGDASFDRATGTVWIAGYKPSLFRVQLQ